MITWYNGDTVYFPSFDAPDLYDQWDYHEENEGVQNLVKRKLAFKTKDEAVKAAEKMWYWML